MKKVTNNLKETHELAKSFAKDLASNSQLATDNSQLGATVVALIGDLGSGKTSFVQGLAKALGVEENVTSPTFVIQKKYSPQGLPSGAPEGNPWGHLVHIDAYRLESGKDLGQLDWQELVSNPENLIVIEWAEKVKEILPDDTMEITFKFIDENKREIRW